ncbi:MAG: hypothetical protein HYV07_26010 [Deltaproteobacteria bacterium]|nr:hypothetical protein [Deltaproteobacteria bacterium]
MRLLLIVAASLNLVGCAATFQTVWGWSDDETRVINAGQRVEVTTELNGAVIQRRGPDGVLTTLGRAPYSDFIEYPVTEVREVPQPRWPFWVGLGADLISYGTPLLVAIGESDFPAGFFGAFLAVTLAVDVGAYLWLGLSDERLKRSDPLNGGASVVYSALGPDGRPSGEQVVRVPRESKAHIVSVTAPGMAPTPSRGAQVLAVMELVDGTPLRLERGLLKSLTDQLRVSLASRGVRAVDRGAQERALADQLRALKKESYASCYDAACQIELGQALAATHILRAQLTQFGAACVLMAEIVDLRAEVTVGAASASGGCEPEALAGLTAKVGQEIDVNRP